MKLSSVSFLEQQAIPERNAFCKFDAQSHVALGGNANPQLSWSGAPAATKSFVITCHDPDVPSKPDDVNHEGREIPPDLERVVFHHWTLIDIDASTTSIDEGAYSNGVTPRGKAGPKAARGARQGLNDYTGWFASDHDMNGDYFGYDGPCPPWNDSIPHHYVFTVYALDVERTPVEGRFMATDVMDAIRGHVLDQASLTGTYTLNPRLR
jgi:Raf kinase inhibitor-like YbhB/YbcL family protein